MNLIETKNFKISANVLGRESSGKLAILIPGKLDTKNYPHLKSHAEYLAGKGFLAVAIDPPGTWDSQGDISLYTTTNTVKAVDELIIYYGNMPTFVLGHSRGGSIAMLAGIGNSKISAFASIMSSYTFKPFLREADTDRKWKELGYRLHRRDLPDSPNEYKEFKLPYSFLQDQIQYDMLEDLKTCKKPKLFIGAREDKNVELETVKIAYDAAAEPKMLRILEGDHDYRQHPDKIEEVNKFLGEFADKHLL